MWTLEETVLGWGVEESGLDRAGYIIVFYFVSCFCIFRLESVPQTNLMGRRTLSTSTLDQG